MAGDHRGRIYEHYVSGGQAGAPETIEGLRSRELHLKQLIARHFPEDREAAVLDIGCGYGALLHFARQVGYRNVSGVDGCAEQISAATRLGIEGVQHGDLVEALEALPAASQDVIAALDVLEHFAKAELVAFVDAVQRVLRPGGCWILRVPNGESPFFGRIRYGDLTHELAFTRESLSQLLLASGFRSVECFEDEPVAHGLKSWVRWGLWKLIRGGLRLYLAAETGDASRGAVFTQNLLAVAVK